MLQKAMSEPLTARHLIFGLLDSQAGVVFGLPDLQRAAGLFEIEASALRVALGRMVKDGVLDSPSRGHYRAGAQMVATRGLWADWRDPESRLKGWAGEWRLIYTGQIPRSPRKTWQNIERILRLRGFVERDAHLWLRPDNFVQSLDDMIADMRHSGLPKKAIACIAGEFAGQEIEHMIALYDVPALEASYRKRLADIQNLRQQMQHMTMPEQARAYFLCGAAAIRSVAFDPLLPDAIMDSGPRQALLDDMVFFIDAGHQVWRELVSGFQMA